MKNTTLKAATVFLAVAAASTAAHARTLYWAGGTTDKNDGDPIPTAVADLTGIWNTSLKNWSTDAAGTTYVAWENGEDRVAILPPSTPNGESTITLEADVVLNRLHVQSLSTSWDGYRLNNTVTEHTITLTGFCPEIEVNSSGFNQLFFLGKVKLAAPGGFFKTGKGMIRLQSDANGVFGQVRMDASQVGQQIGGFLLETTNATMTNATELIINPGVDLIVELQSGVNHRLNENAVVRLVGASDYITRKDTTQGTQHAGRLITSGNAAGTQNIGRLDLDGAGIVKLDTAKGRFIVQDPAGILRPPDNKSVLMIDADANNELLFHPNLAFATGTPTGFPADTLLPWAYTSRALPVKLNPTTKMFEPIPTVPADANPRLWDAGASIRIEGAYAPTATLTNLAVASLGIHNSGAFTLNIEPGDTLEITSGQLAFCPANAGNRIITGGQITSGTNELYVLTSEGTAIALELQSAVVGDLDLIKSGIGNLNLSGTGVNTYTGTTYVNGGLLDVNKVGAATGAGVPGDLVVNTGARVKISAPNTQPLRPDARITLRDRAIFESRDVSTQTYNGMLRFENALMTVSVNNVVRFTCPEGLVFANGGQVHNRNTGMANTTTAFLYLLTDLICEAASSNQTLFTSQAPSNVNTSLFLSEAASAASVERVFNVNKAVGLINGLPELSIDIYVCSWPGKDVDLVKRGNGVMALNKTSGGFRGTVSVEAGTLLYNAPSIPEIVMTAGSTTGTATLSGFASTDGVKIAQGVIFETSLGVVRTNVVRYIDNATQVTLVDGNAPNSVLNNPPYNVTFLAGGTLGAADVTVRNGGTFGGTGSAGGSVIVLEGGAFSPGTATQPIAEFEILQNLEFKPGALWHVDVDATSDVCDIVHVAGDIMLAGECVPLFMNAAKRPRGVWDIATFGGKAEGKMTAQDGCRVVINQAEKTIQLVSTEPGTLFLVK